MTRAPTTITILGRPYVSRDCARCSGQFGDLCKACLADLGFVVAEARMLVATDEVEIMRQATRLREGVTR